METINGSHDEQTTSTEAVVQLPKYKSSDGLAENISVLLNNETEYFSKAHIANIIVSEGLIEARRGQPPFDTARNRIYFAIRGREFQLDDSGEGVFAEEYRNHGGSKQYTWFVRGDIVRQWINNKFGPKERVIGYGALVN